MMDGNGGLSVPPGFRFHPTDEELLYYYLRKKVSYEPIDFDVITEVDLNKLEPWDLKEKCRIGTGPQNEWYFFSHKDKKYPTGTRTNRATTAGFWKATGRDKAIHLSNSKRIGLRKTLVFYTGRAPHGQKTQWIMHEYRLDEDTTAPDLDIQEDGWVICRVFTKKNHTRGFSPNDVDQEEPVVPFNASGTACTFNLKHYSDQPHSDNLTFHPNTSIHLPQLLSSEPTLHTSFLSSISSAVDLQYCPQNLLRLTSSGGGGGGGPSTSASTAATGFNIQQDKFSGDWSFLDKLLATHQSMDQINRSNQFSHVVADFINPPAQRFPFSCHGFEPADFSN